MYKIEIPNNDASSETLGMIYEFENSDQYIDWKNHPIEDFIYELTEYLDYSDEESTKIHQHMISLFDVVFKIK